MPFTWDSFWSAHDTGNLPWLIVATYLLAAALSVWAAFRAEWVQDNRFWWIAAAGLVLLAINKQLDLQTDLTAFFRQVAKDEGWYDQRRAMQVIFILGGGLLALGVGAYLLRLAMHAGPGVRLAMVGLVLLGAYILMRAASFHHIDVALRHTVSGIRLHNFVELGCIFVVIAGAVGALLQPAEAYDEA